MISDIITQNKGMDNFFFGLQAIMTDLIDFFRLFAAYQLFWGFNRFFSFNSSSRFPDFRRRKACAFNGV